MTSARTAWDHPLYYRTGRTWEAGYHLSVGFFDWTERRRYICCWATPSDALLLRRLAKLSGDCANHHVGSLIHFNSLHSLLDCRRALPVVDRLYLSS